MGTQDKNADRNQAMRHYFLREDFDELMGVIPCQDFPFPGDEDASCSLTYPKSTKGAVAELKLRGLTCDGATLEQLVDKGIVKPELMAGFERIFQWEKADIDAAAEWLYDNEYWNSWTHFCWVSNLRFGQAVKAHRVAALRYGLGFSLSFDIPGLVTVIEPAGENGGYAHIRFLSAGTKVTPSK